MKLHYQNKFGEVIFRRVPKTVSIKSILGTDIDDKYKFDLETAEKIVLITDNQGIQIGIHRVKGRTRCYVIGHDTSSTAAILAIEEIKYVGGVTVKELNDARRYTPEPKF